MRAQTTFEYLLLIAGAIILVLIALAVVTTLTNQQSNFLSNQLNTFQNTVSNYAPS